MSQLKETITNSMDKFSNREGNIESTKVSEVGFVESIVGDIIEVKGLSDVRVDEIIEIKDRKCFVMSLSEDLVKAVLLTDGEAIKSGDKAYRTNELASVPVGDDILGRVVDPLGNPLDGKELQKFTTKYLIEKEAAGIMEREGVEVPFQTGIKAIDSIIPIGRGQRELILGDRQTGKTAIALDTIINQKDTGVISVYCAIGQKASSIANMIETLKKHDAFKNVVIVVSTGDSPSGQQFLAPYSATAIGEYFMDKGKDVVCVYDNLTEHAKAYRQVALYLKRPPGREAYPGDIFYLHSRLLERASNLKGKGSITALPICETQGENVSAYIPTNLISITDGQIMLSNNRFQKGFLPAINIGISVSRVGSNAQLPVYKKLSGDLKNSYAQFEELESFTKFGVQVDAATKKILDRGSRVREILKQDQLTPMSVGDQAVSMYMIISGIADTVELSKIEEAETLLIKTVRDKMTEEIEALEQGAKFSDEIEKKLYNLMEKTLLKAGYINKEEEK